MLSDKLKTLRKQHNLTQSQLAKKLYIGQTAVSAWESGRSTPPTDKLQEIADLYGIRMSELLDNTSNTGATGIKIPVLGKVQAGIPTSAISEILDHEEIPADMAARGEYFGLLVRGDSMSPDLKDGDVVIVRCQEDVENGEMAIVAVNGDNATVKKVYKSTQGITLVPINPAYDTKMYTNNEILRLPVEIRGKVVELRRKIG